MKFINALGEGLMNVTEPLVKLLKEHKAALLVVALTAVAATQENEQLAIVEHGSPLRQAVDGDAVAAQIDLESMSLEDALKEAEDKVRQALEDEINPPTPPRKRKVQPYASKIPWTLLDELEAEKHKLAEEKNVRLPFEKDRAGMKK